MFKYNTLSDLKDGTLTTPLRKEGDFIVCQNENGLLVNKVFSDFDFAKKPEEREFVLASDLTSVMEGDLPVEEVIVVEEKKEIIVEEEKTEIVIPEEKIVIDEVKKEEVYISPVMINLPSNIKGRNIKVSVETQRIV